MAEAQAMTPESGLRVLKGQLAVFVIVMPIYGAWKAIHWLWLWFTT